MTLNEAKKIVGNQPIWALKNMITALNIMPLLNTQEDKLHLEAAKLIIKSQKKGKDY